MAWRVDEAVVRGELDNRERGRVRGKIWFVGRSEPVELNLEGNAWRDVAGRVLHFVNRTPKPMDLASFAVEQKGVVGDITASRKVKVPEIPMEQIGEYYAAKKPWPWHWGNALYLEWFSLANGRVVIESSDYDLHVVDDVGWDMTEAEEGEQREANGRAMVGFMERLGEAMAAANAEPAEAEEEDETEPGEEEEPTADDAPMTEAEAEALQERQDLLIDRVTARLEREGDEADYEAILEEELERLRRERGEPEPPKEWEVGYVDIDALWEEAEAEVANRDEDDLDEDEEEHSLVERATELFRYLHATAEEEDWVPADAQAEHPVVELVRAVMCVGPKLAGALRREPWPPPVEVCAITLVRLKRAHGYVEDALTAAESCHEEKLLEPKIIGPVLVELMDIAHDIRALIAELRERLGEGG